MRPLVGAAAPRPPWLRHWPYAIGLLSVLSCPVCLSVNLVHCGQTVGWIKMKLGMQVGLLCPGPKWSKSGEIWGFLAPQVGCTDQGKISCESAHRESLSRVKFPLIGE